MTINWLLDLLGRWSDRKPPSPVFPPTTTTPVPTPPAPISPSTEIAQDLLAFHNQLRQGHGLAPLRLNPLLGQSAQVQATYMALHNNMTHQGIGEKSPWQRMNDAGYRYSRAAENVAFGQEGIPQVMLAWQKSPGHLANILGPCVEMGGAVDISSFGFEYWCVDFGTPAVGMQASPTGEMRTVQYLGGQTSSIAIAPSDDLSS